MLKKYILIIIATFAFASTSTAAAQTSVRKERQAITAGNDFYHKGDYSAAMARYKDALKYNASSAQAIYNLGLTQLRMGENSAQDDKKGQELLQEGIKNLQKASADAAQKFPDLASKANYNLGNLAFHKDDYASAIQSYKQALRFDPDNDDARRNLRIAQLKQQQQNQDQNKDKNKDQDKQDQDKKDQDKQDQNQQQNQDQNKDQDKQKPQDEKISNQTADQILNAVENKENATRARLYNQGQKGSPSRAIGRKNW